MVLTSFMPILITIIESKSISTKLINCDETPPPVALDSNSVLALNKFRVAIQDAIDSSSILMMNKQSVTINLNMSVYKEDAELSGELVNIATLDNFQVTPIDQHVIKRTRKYYRIGITEAIPWTYMKRDPITGETILDTDGNPIWEGYCIDFAEKVSQLLDFDYDLVVPKMGTFGERLADNSWDGLVGDLMTGV